MTPSEIEFGDIETKFFSKNVKIDDLGLVSRYNSDRLTTKSNLKIFPLWGEIASPMTYTL